MSDISSRATTSSSTAGPTSPPGVASGQQSGDQQRERGSALERSGQRDGAALQTDRGVTTIASSVVAKVAALATQEIPGVQAMGKSLSRTFGAIRSKVPGGSSSTTQGVSVEVGEREAAVDVDIVAYYGQSIIETANAIRENVIERIEGMTGLRVVEVNVTVDDLYIESDRDDAQGSRVE